MTKTNKKEMSGDFYITHNESQPGSSSRRDEETNCVKIQRHPKPARNFRRIIKAFILFLWQMKILGDWSRKNRIILPLDSSFP